MKTMNGFTNELLVKKAKRNWRTRCGAFLLAVLASWYGGEAVADVVLTPSATGIVLVTVPTTGAPVQGDGFNEGTASAAGATYSWQAVQYNSLDYLSSGMQVNTSTGAGTYGTHTFYNTNTSLNFSGSGGTVHVAGDNVTWGGSTTFSVTGGATGNIVFRNGQAKFNLGDRLTVNATATLNLNPLTGNETNGSLVLSGGSNQGTINVNGSVLTLTQGGISGTGTIAINQHGYLDLQTNSNATINQNIHGGYVDGNDRGFIRVMTSGTTLAGNLSGSIAFSGANRIKITANNMDVGLSSVRASGTDVVIRSAENLGGDGLTVQGANLTLANGGGFTKTGDVGNVTISNDVFVSSYGMLNSSLTRNSGVSEPIYWTNDADVLQDGGRRFTIDGVISSFTNSYLDINSAYSMSGTVVLTNSNSFDGHMHVHSGILEVSRQANLGTSNNSSDVQYVIIGDTTSTNRAVFRVVGGANTSQTITNWIQVNSSNSFYEVFTTKADGNAIDNAQMADADRFLVVQAGLVEGTGDLNKTGDGILMLNTTNTYSGDTIIWHGVLRISDQNAINNSTGAVLAIGGMTSFEEVNFRPVFETVLIPNVTQGTMSINAKVILNQTNSTVRVTGEGNRTRFTGGIYSDYDNVGIDKAAVLNKDGAGTMVLDSRGAWGDGTKGETNIIQGTLEFSRATYLAGGTITIGTNWHDYKDIEGFDANGNPIVYKAILKLADGATEGIYNSIILNSPAPTTVDDPTAGSYIEVGTGATLSVYGNISSPNYTLSNLNKIGKGELVLGGSSNTYGGWAIVQEGTLTTVEEHNLRNTAGVNLYGNGTTFNMSASSNDQTLSGLKGVDSVNAADSSAWTRRVLIGDNTLTLNQTEMQATLHGAIIGTGTFVKGGAANSEFQTGFEIGSEKFTGSIGVQSGTLTSLTDVTVTGLTGKSGTYFDIRDNTLTFNINSSTQYDGTILSSYPSTPYGNNVIRPEIVKDGVGTVVANFSETNPGSGVTKGFFGNLTINDGNVVSTSDYYMEGGGKLTFGVTPTANGDIKTNTLDVSAHNAYFRVSGTQYSTVHVSLGDLTTGWSTGNGVITVGRILGGDRSDYSGLVVSGTDSLFHELQLQEDRGTGYNNRNVNLKVLGFGGIGNTYNTRAVGENLDRVRVVDLTGNAISALIKDLWAAGCNLPDEKTKNERTALLLDIYRQLSGDTIANAMFMGLDKPWQAAFDRLNLDSQMVYMGPAQGAPQYRGQAIANMRNLWFTPTVQSVTARGDGNARKFGIDRPGYKIGFDKRVARNTSVGFQLGYSSPKLHQGDDRIEASDFQFGVYGGSMVGNYIEMKGFIGFGHQNYKSNRNIYLPEDKILSDGSGGFRAIGGANRSMTAHGRYDGDTFNFSFEVSRPLFLGFSILRPTIGLDSEHAFRYAFTETGDVIAMKFARSSLSRTRARFGLSLETTTLDRAIFTGRLGYSCLLGGNDYAEAKGQFVGVAADSQTIRSVAVGKSYFETGVGMRVFLNPVKTLALVGNYDATIGNRWAEHQALVGFTYLY